MIHKAGTRQTLKDFSIISFLVFGAFAKLRKSTISFVMYVRPSASNNSAFTGRILMKLDIWAFSETLSRKLKYIKIQHE
jgi:hypothetical protein